MKLTQSLFLAERRAPSCDLAGVYFKYPESLSKKMLIFLLRAPASYELEARACSAIGCWKPTGNSTSDRKLEVDPLR